MAGRIPESFINDLLSRVDVLDVIQSRIQVRKAGREYQALCPFHDENTPSFTISPQKQFYHCFGCRAHGNAIGFIMEFEQLGFVDAVEELARHAGMEVPRDDSAPRDDLSPLFAIMSEADRYFQQQLRQSQGAIDYLRDRGITGEIAQTFGIGFAPAGWDNLIRQLNPSSSADRQKLMNQAGLLSSNDKGRHYDKFRARIMFPIHDTRGRVIAFGGRVIDPEDSPKYLNSPETRLFHKGRQLYGLYQIKQQREKPMRLIVVEGYMDVIALAQFGLNNAVATLGTATTTEHAETLFRSCNEIVFCFDGDRAGRDAAARAMDAVLPRLRDGRQCRFLLLPDGEDPDSMVRSQGQETFEASTICATPLSDFFFDHVCQDIDMTSLDGRALMIERARPALTKIPEGSFRDMMFERMADLAKTTVELRPRPDNDTGVVKRTSQNPSSRRLVRTAINCLLLAPETARHLECVDETVDALSRLQRPGIALLTELIRYCSTREDISAAHIIEHWRGRPEADHLSKLLQLSDELPISDHAGEFDGCLRQLLRESWKAQLDELQHKIASAGHRALSSDEMQLFNSLSQRLTQT